MYMWLFMFSMKHGMEFNWIFVQMCICKIYTEPILEILLVETHTHTYLYSCTLKILIPDQRTDTLTLSVWSMKSQMFGPYKLETKQLHVPCNLIKQPRNAYTHYSNTNRYACHPVSQLASQSVSQLAIHWINRTRIFLGNDPKHLSLLYYILLHANWMAYHRH